MKGERKVRYISCCGSKNLNEIDGQEFEAYDLDDLLDGLKQYGEVHLAYWSDEPDHDLDLWLKLDGVRPGNGKLRTLRDLRDYLKTLDDEELISQRRHVGKLMYGLTEMVGAHAQISLLLEELIAELERRGVR